MRPVAIAASFICLASPPLLGQQSRVDAEAVTRVAAPLRENPALDSRTLVTIPPKTSVKVASYLNGWCAVEYHQLTGHVVEVFLRFPSVRAPQPTASSGGGGYVNSRGDWVPSPVLPLDGQPPDGASAQCRDRTYSFSRSRRGTCSHHGGVARWL